MEDRFARLEDSNGLRLSWHVWPTNRIDVVSCSVPIGVIYTPLKSMPARWRMSPFSAAGATGS